MPFLCRSTKKWRKKGNQDVPSWISLSVPLFKEKQEKKYKLLLHHSPPCHHERQAEKAKSFLFEIWLSKGA
jgi:hypothetical protein